MEPCRLRRFLSLTYVPTVDAAMYVCLNFQMSWPEPPARDASGVSTSPPDRLTCKNCSRCFGKVRPRLETNTRPAIRLRQLTETDHGTGVFFLKLTNRYLISYVIVTLETILFSPACTGTDETDSASPPIPIAKPALNIIGG